MSDLTGKVALISGAARGQGRSHALALAREGAHIVGFDLCEQIPTTRIPMSSPADLEETERLVKDAGGEVLTVVADARVSADTQRVVDAAMERFGRIDIVVANAGIDSIDPTIDMPDDAWDDVIAVNLTGVFRTIRPALRPMIEAGNGGSIVITSSCAGLTPYPNHIHYGAAKYGVIGVMQCLALELAAHRIRVNALAPSAVRTDLALNPVLFELFTGRSDATAEDAAPIFQNLNLIERPWIEPEEVSNAVVWLSGDMAKAITGIVLPIDLGFMIKGPFNAKDAAIRIDGSNAAGLI
ncbi:mycofactocin-coupled SDR family oxidoreductase [Nocardioides agariphilus]|uniref:Mycofactocin-coupled SDR family oxidoreductase n=1 Tax=Nocardioides agariphilus TaxID=433664 RepID=A0A930VPC7_9ACTN|nr:mycofactocin-coupled SDR family oxidoreductase [Nocardioides agariphilus]MBF4769351.1 mycofactocin-coupled SDR family oxidoreductase [Nocardioides agariphilus]